IAAGSPLRRRTSTSIRWTPDTGCTSRHRVPWSICSRRVFHDRAGPGRIGYVRVCPVRQDATVVRWRCPAIMARVVVVCAVVRGLGAAASVRAQPHGALIWRAPGGWPGAGDVRARIERRLGAPIAVADLGVAVDVVDRGEGGAPRFVAR